MAENGRAHLDFFGGAGALNYGHNNPVLKRALIGYFAGDHVTHSLDVMTVAKREFLETFKAKILGPHGLDLQGAVPRSDGDKQRQGGIEAGA